MNKMQKVFEANGFVTGDHIKDFGYTIPYCLYYYNPSTNCYVSAVFYNNQFVEAAFEWYKSTKNTRRPKVNYCDKKWEEKLIAGSFSPYKLALVRSVDEVVELLGGKV